MHDLSPFAIGGSDSAHTPFPFPHPAIGEPPAKGKPPHPPQEAAQFGPESQQLLYMEHHQSFEMQQSGSTSIEVITNDGDVITLNMATHWQAAIHHGESASANHHSEYAAFEHYQGYAIEFQVEGELDEGEMKALNALMNQVAEVTDDFFAGNLPAAIEHMDKLKLDSSEFDALAVSMQRSISVSMTEAYQSVSEMVPSTPPVSLSTLPNLFNYMEEVDEMVKEVDALFERIQMPDQFVNSLLSQAIERDPRSELFSEQMKSAIDHFLDQITTRALGAEPEAAVEHSTEEEATAA